MISLIRLLSEIFKIIKTSKLKSTLSMILQAVRDSSSDSSSSSSSAASSSSEDSSEEERKKKAAKKVRKQRKPVFEIGELILIVLLGCRLRWLRKGRRL